MAIEELEQRLPAAPPINLDECEAVSHRNRILHYGAAAAKVSAKMLGCAGAGALIGLGVAELTPAHLQVAGSNASARLIPGQNYNKGSLDGAISAEKATNLQVGGTSIGVDLKINFDSSDIIQNGKINAAILPAMVSLYSDPKQIESDTATALEEHFIVFGSIGGGLGILALGGVAGYKRWREKYDEKHGIDREAARAYYAPERRLAKRIAGGLALAAAVATIPAGTATQPAPKPIGGNPAFVGTPLEGVKLSGPLAPAVPFVINYIEEYGQKTDQYFNQLNTVLVEYLKTNPAAVPSGDNVENFYFATDRHCDTGMDRVDETLIKHYGINLLVSAGDDDLNGNFKFESGCTSDLVERLKKIGVPVVLIRGNHDSVMTGNDEAKQGAFVLNDKIVHIKGLNFIGEPDPRRSDFGIPIHLINPDYTVLDQGKHIGELACKARQPVIAILHDPRAGKEAIANGCGYVVLALDGHTHDQAGPTPVDIKLPNPNLQIKVKQGMPGEPTEPEDPATGEQFTGGSAGGAPGPGQANNPDPLENLTVGPLNHNAYTYIISVNKDTGRLIGITGFVFTPDQKISTWQTITDPNYQNLAAAPK